MSIPIPMSERVKAFWRRWSARESAANGIWCTPDTSGVRFTALGIAKDGMFAGSMRHDGRLGH